MLKSLQGKKINWKRIISFLYKARMTSGLKSLQGNISSHEGLNIRKTASWWRSYTHPPMTVRSGKDEKTWYTALSISLQCLRRRIRRLQGPRSFRVDSLGSLIESVRESVTMPWEDNSVLLASNAASACKHLSSATLLSVRASQPGSSRIVIKEKPSAFLNPWIKGKSSSFNARV